jgi:hypothetical protein
MATTPTGSPLDAEAFDMRIHVCPCKSGSIRDWHWQRQAN